MTTRTPASASSPLLCAVAVWAAMTIQPRDGGAHRFRPDVLSLRSRAPGLFSLHTSAPVEGEAPPPVPLWPAACQAIASELRCPPDLEWPPTLALVGQGTLARELIVLFEDLDGHTRSAATAPGSRSIAIPAPERAALRRQLAGYLPLGVAHILTGPDHLLFVLGLLALATSRRALFWSITAFTLGHSLTLALATFGILSLSQPPVEALIALSLVLVAGEITSTDRARRATATLPAAFGLVHGLGFAGALETAGLTGLEIPWALLGFNVGVELGQLAFVVAVVAAVAVVSRLTGLRERRRAELASAYLIGTTGVWLALDRIVSLWQRT